MTFDYDAFYAENPDGLGPPTDAFVAFFRQYEGPSLRVLDIGCGQGRDALFIARMGHVVVGVDMSPHGVADMMAVARAEGLAIEGHVANILDWTPDGAFDVLLIDRTLHMLDEPARYDALAALLLCLRPGGDLLLADEPSNMPGFHAVLQASGRRWEDYPTKPKGLLFARGAP